jgi:hypothetical protein
MVTITGIFMRPGFKKLTVPDQVLATEPLPEQFMTAFC